MKFVNQFRQDIEKYQAQSTNGTVYYPFSSCDIDLIQKIRNHTASNNFFIFCRSPKEFNYPINYNKNINNALEESGYEITSVKQYNIYEIVDLIEFESEMKEKFGGADYSPLNYRLYNFRPYLKRFCLKKDDRNIIFYHVIYDPIAFLVLINRLKEEFVNSLRLGIALRNKIDPYFANFNLFQPQANLLQLINPEFIISPKTYWYPKENQINFFVNWEGIYAPPIEIDENIVICHRQELAMEKESLFELYRPLSDAGLIEI